MGDLEKEFYTGLPDGEYRDIISDCQQKVQVQYSYSQQKVRTGTGGRCYTVISVVISSGLSNE